MKQQPVCQEFVEEAMGLLDDNRCLNIARTYCLPSNLVPRMLAFLFFDFMPPVSTVRQYRQHHFVCKQKYNRFTLSYCKTYIVSYNRQMHLCTSM